MIRNWMGSIAAAVFLIELAHPATAQTPSSGVVRYNRDIRPILSENCFFCHGPDQNKRKGKLRLDVREAALAKEAFVPGKADESELVRRIFSADPEEVMPPPKSQKKLTSAQKQQVRDWIAQGAEYEKHWAYISPAKPSVSPTSQAIDVLVRHRLGDLGLQPSPEADRRTLIRRLSFDLRGLPPTPAEVEHFEADAMPEAYEKVVEQFLASPAYGERMAINWLDVVRYADTIGYHSDNPRNVWPYRDYVIRAFNENKPYDQFTREQLAGDLLPGSTQEQKVASAFNRLLLTTEEGGAQPKDYEARMLTDRVRAVAAVWMAQTIGCAQCHDHKFDPITSRDFYSLGAFFADIKEPIIGRREDGMAVATDQEAAQLKRLNEAVSRSRQEFEVPRPEVFASWHEAAIDTISAESHWTVLKPEEATASSGVKLTVDLGGVVQSDKNPPHGTDLYRIKVRPTLWGIVGFRLEVLPSDKLPDQGPGRGGEGSFVLSEFHLEDENGQIVRLASASATWADDGHSPESAIDGHVDATHGWAVQHLSNVPQTICFATEQPLDPDGTWTIVLDQNSGSNRVIGRFRLSATVDPAVVRAPKTTLPPRDIVEILKANASTWTEAQANRLATYERSIAPELAGLRHALAAAQSTRDEFEGSLPHCLVSVTAETPRPVRILPRGNWMLETGELVEPAVPAYLASSFSLPTDRRLNRLDLADWLVAPANPLTARVFVNRLWKQFFGMGLSKVLDDFGAQGEPPPNQPLLDWLACEFTESGWDVKHLVRLIVTSQTYRQASDASKEALAQDPFNRALARQSRWRLEAELVRDNALTISGLLHGQIGGPSVKPYQPEGYWENLNFPVRTYEASKGPDQYRRGLYTWWQRSFAHPSLLAFDAPTREECAADRSRSNIPQQALVLLNDPTYVEAARALAARILQEGGADTQSRINWAWRQALDRLPRADEIATAQQLLAKHLADYRQHADDADALLKTGQMPLVPGLDHTEWAAWTSVARVILNLHETITRS